MELGVAAGVAAMWAAYKASVDEGHNPAVGDVIRSSLRRLIQLTREDECNCKARGDCHSWCASVEVLWMAYGPAFRDKRLGTGHFLGEYKHPYEAEVDYTPYLKKFPYRRPGEYGRDGVGKGRFEFPLTGNPGFDMLIKGAAYSHLSSRTDPIGRIGDTGGPRPKEWMLVSALLPTTLIAATEVWSVASRQEREVHSKEDEL